VVGRMRNENVFTLWCVVQIWGAIFALIGVVCIVVNKILAGHFVSTLAVSLFHSQLPDFPSHSILIFAPHAQLSLPRPTVRCLWAPEGDAVLSLAFNFLRSRVVSNRSFEPGSRTCVRVESLVISAWRSHVRARAVTVEDDNQRIPPRAPLQCSPQ
jgi:hypothetical protein